MKIDKNCDSAKIDRLRKFKEYYERLSKEREKFKKVRQSSPSIEYNFGFKSMLYKMITNKFKELDRPKVLDVSCGHGNDLKKLNEKKDIIGIGMDISYNQIRLAISENRTYTKLFFITAISETLPFVSTHFDCVVFSEVLEHLPLYSVNLAIEEIFRVLKSGGYLFITTPNRYRISSVIGRTLPNFIKNNIKRIFEGAPVDIDTFWPNFLATEHIHEFSIKELRSLLERHKFKVLELKGGVIPVPFRKIFDKYPNLIKFWKIINKVFLSHLPFSIFFKNAILICAQKLKLDFSKLEKVNILYMISTGTIGGGEQHLLYLADRLNKDKYSLFFSLPYEGTFANELKKRNLPVLILNMKTKFKPLAFFKIKDFIKINNIKIVHTHGARMDFYGRIAAKWAGAPIIISTVHTSLYTYMNWPIVKKIYIFLDTITAKFCDKIICVSKKLADDLINKAKIESDKIVVIYNGIDLAKFENIGNINYLKDEFELYNRRVIGAIGRLEDYKGQIYLLRSIKKLKAYFPDIKCLFVGDGPLRKPLEDESRHLNITQNCVFTRSRTDIPQILTVLDILVLPSLAEGFPLVLLEAMAMERPIVATKVGGVPEIVEDEKNGLLVEPKDPDALANAVKYMLENTQFAKQMASMGKKIAKEQFTVEQMIGNLDNIYQVLIREKIYHEHINGCR